MPTLLEVVKRTVLEKQGSDVAVIDMEGTNPFTDYFVITTARNQQHADSIAEAVIDAANKAGYECRCKEGDKNASWVLVDLNGIIVHIFTSDARLLYKLENLWGDRPIEHIVD